jgi:hypothetical protein
MDADEFICVRLMDICGYSGLFSAAWGAPVMNPNEFMD